MTLRRPGQVGQGDRSGADRAARDVAQTPAVALDDAESGGPKAGVDPENAHGAIGTEAKAARGQRRLVRCRNRPRTEWKNTGAAKQSGATRSSRPTAPVTDELPRKLRTPASRLSAVITNSPSVPAAPAIGAHRERGDRVERRHPVQQQADDRRGAGAGAERAPRERAADRARDRPAAQPPARDFLADLGGGDDEDEEEDQEGAAPVGSPAGRAGAAPARGSCRTR